MAEEVLTEENEILFCVYNKKNGKISYEENIGKIYPIIDQEVKMKAIHLPSKAEEYDNDEELEKSIKKHINKWLDIPKDTLQLAIWNIKRSWVYERFHTLNYLRALGDTGQGKTRFLDVLGYIHYKPIATSGATTAAPIFRIINKWKPTLIMDEADFSRSDESQDIIKIINQGYEKNKNIMRCDQFDAKKIDFFDPFCPKILATRKSFTDKAVESRCITQVMTGTSRDDIPFNLNNDFWNDSKIIRNKLLMWRFRNYDKIKPFNNVFPKELSHIEPRLKQTFSSFISLFKHDNEQLSVFKNFIIKYQDELIDERRNSFDGLIILGIFKLLERGVVDFDIKDIIESGNITDFRGNLVKSRSISSRIKAFGFGKNIVRRVGDSTKRCVNLNSVLLSNLFKRYGYDVTVVTVLGVTSEDLNVNENDDIIIKNNEGGGLPIYCNNRNTVTLKYDKNSLKSIILKYINKSNKKGKSVDVDLLISNIGDEHKNLINEILSDLKKSGIIFEPKKGLLKKL